MLKQTGFLILLSAGLSFCTPSKSISQLPQTDFSWANASYTIVISYSDECPFCIRYTAKIREIRKSLPENWNFKLLKVLPEEQWDFDGIDEFSADIIHDSTQSITKFLGIQVYPEAVIVDSAANLVYKGAIDDRAHETGLSKTAITTHYLDDAIARLSQGEKANEPFPLAKGCYIEFNEEN